MTKINSNIIKDMENDPSGIFPLISRGEFEVVNYLLDKKIVNINTIDCNGNDVVSRLLKANQYNLVLTYIKKRNWNVNHQNNEGDTFGHLLACYSGVGSIKIVDALMKKKNFLPNIRNNKGETILDKATNNKYLITSLKILEDKRFTSIDLYDFKNLFKLSIANNSYGSYSKVNNFNIMLKSLSKKSLQPNMQLLVDRIMDNKEAIRNDIENNSFEIIETIINSTIEEVSA